MSSFSPALAMAAGAPLAVLSVGHGWPGLALAALATVMAGLGRDIVGALSHRTLAPAQRQLRWLLKHGYVSEQLTAQQLVELTQSTHAQEMATRQAALTRVPDAPSSGTSGQATPAAPPAEISSGAGTVASSAPRGEAASLPPGRPDTTGP